MTRPYVSVVTPYQSPSGSSLSQFVLFPQGRPHRWRCRVLSAPPCQIWESQFAAELVCS